MHAIWLILLCGSTSVSAFSERTLRLQVSEDAPPGRLVARMEDSDVEHVHSYELSSGDGRFSWHKASAEIRVARALDREESASARLVLVRHEPPLPAAVLVVLIQIDDVNDCSPRFPIALHNMSVLESTVVGVRIPLPAAEDQDAGDNGRIVRYELESCQCQMTDDTLQWSGCNETWKLSIDPILSLETTKELDRERMSVCILNVTASDGGFPTRTGSMSVWITIVDVNDVAPRFPHDRYSFTVDASAVGGSIGRVAAVDPDQGENGRVLYRIRRPDDVPFLRLNESSGEILLESQPPSSSASQIHHVWIEARDNGTPSLSAAAQLEIHFRSGKSTTAATPSTRDCVVFRPRTGGPSWAEVNGDAGEAVGVLSFNDSSSSRNVNAIELAPESADQFRLLPFGRHALLSLRKAVPKEARARLEVVVRVEGLNDTIFEVLVVGDTNSVDTTDLDVLVPLANAHAPIALVALRQYELSRVRILDLNGIPNGALHVDRADILWMQGDGSRPSVIANHSILLTGWRSTEEDVRPKPLRMRIHLIPETRANQHAPFSETLNHSVGHVLWGGQSFRLPLKLADKDPNSTVRAFVEGPMAAYFTVSRAGELRLEPGSRVDRLGRRAIVPLRLIDSGTPPRESTATVVVSFNNASDDNYWTRYNNQVDECVRVTDLPFCFDRPRHIPFTSRRMRFVLTRSNSKEFRLDPLLGSLCLSNNVLPGKYESVVRADLDGRHAELTYRLVVMDARFRAPTLPDWSSDPLSIEVRENSDPSKSLVEFGTLPPGTRLELENTTVFRLSPPGKIVSEGPLDREISMSYAFQLAIANGNCKRSRRVEVNVKDENDAAPHFVNVRRTITIRADAPAGSFVARFSAVDLDEGDAGRVTYWLDSVASQYFWADESNGFIYLKIFAHSLPDHEIVASLTARDSAEPFHNSTLQVSFIKVEVPTVTPYPDHRSIFIEEEDQPSIGTCISRLSLAKNSRFWLIPDTEKSDSPFAILPVDGCIVLTRQPEWSHSSGVYHMRVNVTHPNVSPDCHDDSSSQLMDVRIILLRSRRPPTPQCSTTDTIHVGRLSAGSSIFRLRSPDAEIGGAVVAWRLRNVTGVIMPFRINPVNGDVISLMDMVSGEKAVTWSIFYDVTDVSVSNGSVATSCKLTITLSSRTSAVARCFRQPFMWIDIFHNLQAGDVLGQLDAIATTDRYYLTPPDQSIVTFNSSTGELRVGAHCHGSPGEIRTIWMCCEDDTCIPLHLHFLVARFKSWSHFNHTTIDVFERNNEDVSEPLETVPILGPGWRYSLIRSRPSPRFHVSLHPHTASLAVVALSRQHDANDEEILETIAIRADNTDVAVKPQWLSLNLRLAARSPLLFHKISLLEIAEDSPPSTRLRLFTDERDAPKRNKPSGEFKRSTDTPRATWKMNACWPEPCPVRLRNGTDDDLPELELVSALDREHVDMYTILFEITTGGQSRRRAVHLRVADVNDEPPKCRLNQAVWMDEGNSTTSVTIRPNCWDLDEEENAELAVRADGSAAAVVDMMLLEIANSRNGTQPNDIHVVVFDRAKSGAVDKTRRAESATIRLLRTNQLATEDQLSFVGGARITIRPQSPPTLPLLDDSRSSRERRISLGRLSLTGSVLSTWKSVRFYVDVKASAPNAVVLDEKTGELWMTSSGGGGEAQYAGSPIKFRVFAVAESGVAEDTALQKWTWTSAMIQLNIDRLFLHEETTHNIVLLDSEASTPLGRTLVQLSERADHYRLVGNETVTSLFDVDRGGVLRLRHNLPKSLTTQHSPASPLQFDVVQTKVGDNDASISRVRIWLVDDWMDAVVAFDGDGQRDVEERTRILVAEHTPPDWPLLLLQDNKDVEIETELARFSAATRLVTMAQPAPQFNATSWEIVKSPRTVVYVTPIGNIPRLTLEKLSLLIKATTSWRNGKTAKDLSALLKQRSNCEACISGHYRWRLHTTDAETPFRLTTGGELKMRGLWCRDGCTYSILASVHDVFSGNYALLNLEITVESGRLPSILIVTDISTAGRRGQIIGNVSMGDSCGFYRILPESLPRAHFLVEPLTGLLTLHHAVNVSTIPRELGFEMESRCDGQKKLRHLTVAFDDLDCDLTETIWLPTLNVTLAERSPLGTTVYGGNTTTMTRQLVWSIDSASSGSSFDIHPMDGSVTLRRALDAETADEHRMTLIAVHHVSGRECYRRNLSISIDNEDDEPPLVLPRVCRTIFMRRDVFNQVSSNQQLLVHRMNVVDPDTPNLVFSLEDTRPITTDLFHVNVTTGEVWMSRTAESRLVADRFELFLVATDGEGRRANQRLDINIIPAGQSPVIDVNRTLSIANGTGVSVMSPTPFSRHAIGWLDLEGQDVPLSDDGVWIPSSRRSLPSIRSSPRKPVNLYTYSASSSTLSTHLLDVVFASDDAINSDADVSHHEIGLSEKTCKGDVIWVIETRRRRLVVEPRHLFELTDGDKVVRARQCLQPHGRSFGLTLTPSDGNRTLETVSITMLPSESCPTSGLARFDDFTVLEGTKGLIGRIPLPTSPSTEVSLRRDDGLFALERTGAIYARESLDAEETSVHVVLVENRTRSSGCSALSAIFIRVRDVNEFAPRFDRTVYMVNVTENDEPSAVGTLLTLTATDGDVESATTTTSTFRIVTGNEDGAFHLDSHNGQLALRRPLDADAGQRERKLRVEVTDGVHADVADVLVTILNVNDNPPKFVGRLEWSVSKNAPIGSTIGRVSTHDLDDESTLTCTLVDDEYGVFSVDGDGTLRLVGSLNRSQNVYELSFAVSDGLWSVRSRGSVTVIDADGGHPPKCDWRESKGDDDEPPQLLCGEADDLLSRKRPLHYRLITPSRTCKLNAITGQLGCVDAPEGLLVEVCDSGLPELCTIVNTSRQTQISAPAMPVHMLLRKQIVEMLDLTGSDEEETTPLNNSPVLLETHIGARSRVGTRLAQLTLNRLEDSVPTLAWTSSRLVSFDWTRENDRRNLIMTLGQETKSMSDERLEVTVASMTARRPIFAEARLHIAIEFSDSSPAPQFGASAFHTKLGARAAGRVGALVFDFRLGAPAIGGCRVRIVEGDLADTDDQAICCSPFGRLEICAPDVLSFAASDEIVLLVELLDAARAVRSATRLHVTIVDGDDDDSAVVMHVREGSPPSVRLMKLDNDRTVSRLISGNELLQIDSNGTLTLSGALDFRLIQLVDAHLSRNGEPGRALRLVVDRDFDDDDDLCKLPSRQLDIEVIEQNTPHVPIRLVARKKIVCQSARVGQDVEIRSNCTTVVPTAANSTIFSFTTIGATCNQRWNVSVSSVRSHVPPTSIDARHSLFSLVLWLPTRGAAADWIVQLRKHFQHMAVHPFGALALDAHRLRLIMTMIDAAGQPVSKPDALAALGSWLRRSKNTTAVVEKMDTDETCERRCTNAGERCISEPRRIGDQIVELRGQQMFFILPKMRLAPRCVCASATCRQLDARIPATSVEEPERAEEDDDSIGSPFVSVGLGRSATLRASLDKIQLPAEFEFQIAYEESTSLLAVEWRSVDAPVRLVLESWRGSLRLRLVFLDTSNNDLVVDDDDDDDDLDEERTSEDQLGMKIHVHEPLRLRLDTRFTGAVQKLLVESVSNGSAAVLEHVIWPDADLVIGQPGKQQSRAGRRSVGCVRMPKSLHQLATISGPTWLGCSTTDTQTPCNRDGVKRCGSITKCVDERFDLRCQCEEDLEAADCRQGAQLAVCVDGDGEAEWRSDVVLSGSSSHTVEVDVSVGDSDNAITRISATLGAVLQMELHRHNAHLLLWRTYAAQNEVDDKMSALESDAPLAQRSDEWRRLRFDYSSAGDLSLSVDGTTVFTSSIEENQSIEILDTHSPVILRLDGSGCVRRLVLDGQAQPLSATHHRLRDQRLHVEWRGRVLIMDSEWRAWRDALLPLIVPVLSLLLVSLVLLIAVRHARSNRSKSSVMVVDKSTHVDPTPSSTNFPLQEQSSTWNIHFY